MMRFLKQAKFTLPIAAAFVLTAIAVLAVLSARGNHAEAAITITINVSDFKFCTPGQSPCPDSPLDTTVAASVGDTISFKLVNPQVFPHTSSHCLTNPSVDLFADCDFNLFDFDGVAGGNGDWLIPGSVNNSNVYFECNIHAQMTGVIVVGSPATPAPIPVGGLADFPDIDELPADASGSSGGSLFALTALVGGLVAALAMFAAGAWYARKGWLR